jgi:hypothetical protein
MGIILLIVAVVLTSIVTAISLIVTPIYYIITFKWKSGAKQLDRWFYKLALSVDQFGNTSTATVLQLTLAKKGGHTFGNPDDTVSYCLGRLKMQGKLTKTGKLIVKILHILEANHVEKAIEHKIEADQEALLRIQENKYYK